MDKNIHMGYTMEQVIADINSTIKSSSTTVADNKPLGKSKVKSFNLKRKPIRRIVRSK